MNSNMKSYVMIVNDGPYGNERPYNAFRVGMNLVKRGEADLKVFLIGDGVQCGVKDQNPPKGYYNIARMVKFIGGRGEVAT